MKRLNHPYTYQTTSGDKFQRSTTAVLVCLIFCIGLTLLSNDASETLPNDLEEEPLAGINVTTLQVVTPFPRKIWQTSKTGPAGFKDDDREAVRTWTKMNHNWRYEIITQYSAESYVRDRFADRPAVVEVFTELQDPILRADMIRYLVLLADGGLYSDLDTALLKPIDDWIPPPFRDLTNVVIGIEYDKLKGDRWVDWSLDLQFSTWTILAKPGHLLFELTVRRVVQRLKDLANKQGKALSRMDVTFREVLDTTGPALFTEVVFEMLSQQTGTNFTWLNVTRLKAPRLVEDILILPITSFGSGQGHSNAGQPDEGSALVQHLFKGSWKNEHPIEEERHDDSDGHDEKGGEKDESSINHELGNDGNKTEESNQQQDSRVQEEVGDAKDEDSKKATEESKSKEDSGHTDFDEKERDEKVGQDGRENDKKNEAESRNDQRKDKDEASAKDNATDSEDHEDESKRKTEP